MSLTRVLKCPCNPDHIYASAAAFYAHKKTQRHKAWEIGQHSEKIEAKRRDDEIFRLNLKLKDRDEQIEKLIIEKNNLIEKLKNPQQESSFSDNDIRTLIFSCEKLKKQNEKLVFENKRLMKLLKSC
jgi:hypothetical protein